MLKKITEDNFRECLKLEVEENQKNFVANNTHSLAQAWLYYENAKPFAIYNDDEMVGFVMLAMDYNGGAAKGICDLWRFMIDKKYQRKGFGKAAMEAVISYVKEEFDYKKIMTSFVQGNTSAENLYKSFGFVPNGEFDGDEIVMILDFIKN